MIGIRPAKAAAQGREVRQPKHHDAQLADRADRPELGSAAGDVVDIARILARTDADTRTALDLDPGEATSLHYAFGGLELS